MERGQSWTADGRRVAAASYRMAAVDPISRFEFNLDDSSVSQFTDQISDVTDIFEEDVTEEDATTESEIGHSTAKNLCKDKEDSNIKKRNLQHKEKMGEMKRLRLVVEENQALMEKANARTHRVQELNLVRDFVSMFENSNDPPAKIAELRKRLDEESKRLVLESLKLLDENDDGKRFLTETNARTCKVQKLVYIRNVASMFENSSNPPTELAEMQKRLLDESYKLVVEKEGGNTGKETKK